MMFICRLPIAAVLTVATVIPPAYAAEVVTGGGEHGVDGVAAGMGEVIAAHAVVSLEQGRLVFRGLI